MTLARDIFAAIGVWFVIALALAFGWCVLRGMAERVRRPRVTVYRPGEGESEVVDLHEFAERVAGGRR